MALPENRKAVMEILRIISPLVIGQQVPEELCTRGPATAFEIIPAGDDYPGREALWPLWFVRSRCIETGKTLYEKGNLSDFISENELFNIFHRYFREVKNNPYRIDIVGGRRIDDNLPTAVRIRDNNFQTQFCFEWGKEQDKADAIRKIYMSGGKFAKGSDEYLAILSLLSEIEPITYKGGPDPELPFESDWLLEYQKSLDMCRTGKYRYVFFRNMYEHRCRNTACEIIFSKVAE